MAFLGKIELTQLLSPPSRVIEPFNPDNVAEVAYELCLGNEVYLTDSTTKKKEVLDDKNSQVVIKPGQFALLLTHETVTVPLENIAFISIKFSQKIKGLINVSGFHVDPGFSGKIIFSVYNAGSATIVLDKGEPYFIIWFSTLTSSSANYNGTHQGQDKISAKTIEVLQGDLASPNVLLERIKKNESELSNVKTLAGSIISLAVAIFVIAVNTLVKSCSDESKFNEGYNVGVKEIQARTQIDKAFSSYNVDSLVSVKIDSILKGKKIGSRDSK